jgi:hypothetical protein
VQTIILRTKSAHLFLRVRSKYIFSNAYFLLYSFGLHPRKYDFLRHSQKGTVQKYSGIAIHQAFFCLYTPVLLLLLMYQYAHLNKPKNIIIYAIITMIAACGSFVYLQFYGKVTACTLNQVFSSMQQRTDLPLCNTFIKRLLVPGQRCFVLPLSSLKPQGHEDALGGGRAGYGPPDSRAAKAA